MAKGRTYQSFFTYFLIAVIIITSASLAGIYLLLNTGLYKGKEPIYTTLAITEIDVFDGEKVLTNQTIIVKGDDIECIGKDCEIPSDARKISGKGKSLIPGLIDMHIHFYAPSKENAEMSPQRQFLDYIKQRPDVRKNFHLAGVTTVRSLGDIAENILKLRLQIEAGEMAGPDVYCTGPIFTAPNGHPAGTIYQGNEVLIANGTHQVDNNADAEKLVDELAAMEVHGIKAVYDDIGGKHPKLKGEVLKAIIQKAQEHNLWVAVHTGTTEDVMEAVLWGANSIEHGASDLLDSTTIQLLKEKQILYVPTLAITETSNKDSLFQTPAFQNIRLLVEAGVPIGAGTDTYNDLAFGKSLHRELELLVEAGLTPSQALSSATKVAALYLRIDHLAGSISPDKRADLVLINGKPWENISDVRNVEMVIQSGVIVRNEAGILD